MSLSRHEKVRSIGAIVDTGFGLALVADPAMSRDTRRLTPPLSALRVVAAVAQLRGSSAAGWAAVAGSVAVVGRDLAPAIADRAPAAVRPAARSKTFDDHRAELAERRARESPRMRRVKAARAIVGGAFSFAAATDRSLPWYRSVLFGLFGAMGIARGAARGQPAETSRALMTATGVGMVAGLALALTSVGAGLRRR